MSRIAQAAALTAAAGAALAAGAGVAAADSQAAGVAAHSPGVLSGNVLQMPIHIPINICGNTVNIPGAVNPTFGNSCANIDTHEHFVGQFDEKRVRVARIEGHRHEEGDRYENGRGRGHEEGDRYNNDRDRGHEEGDDNNDND